MAETEAPISALRTRPATATDIPRLVPMINAAFVVESFLEGTRTDAVRLAAMLEKGTVLVTVDASGELVASVYLEVRGRAATWVSWRWPRPIREPGWDV